MASPDFSKYIDLTVYDLQPIEIYNAAIEYARTALPEWTPVTGSVEDAMLQATSTMTAYLLGAINRLPAGNIEGMLRLLGVERSSGTQATGTVTIVVKDDAGYTIPAGSRCGYLDTSIEEPQFFVFEISATGNADDLVIAAGTTTVTAAITAVNFEKYPALLAGTSLQMLSAISSVNSITTVTAIDRGTDSESDEQYFTRAMTKFASMSETLVTPNQFTAYVLDNYSSAYRAKTISRLKNQKTVTTMSRNANNVVTAYLGSGHGASAGDVVRVLGATNSTLNGVYTLTGATAASVTYTSIGATLSGASATAMLCPKFETANQNGYVSVYVCGLNGASLTASQLSTIEADLTEKALAGLTVRVMNAQVVPIYISAEITIKYGYTVNAVYAAVEAAMDAYLSPDYWDWSSTFYRNELISLLDKVDGVDRVLNVSIYEDSDLVTTGEFGDTDCVFKYQGVLPQHDTGVGAF